MEKQSGLRLLPERQCKYNYETVNRLISKLLIIKDLNDVYRGRTSFLLRIFKRYRKFSRVERKVSWKKYRAITQQYFFQDAMSMTPVFTA